MRIFNSLSPLTPDLVRELPLESSTAAWNGEPLEPSFQWAVAVDPLAFWFRASIPGSPQYDASHRRGEFVEGLWKRDVAEIFIAEPDGQYQEFNVSPAGAWWTCYFPSYRQPALSTKRPETLWIESSVGASSWNVLFAVRRSELSVTISESISIHVAAISYAATDLYLSSHPLVGATPDFHRVECFLPVEFVSLEKEG